MQWFLDIFFVEGDLVKTVVGLFGFMFFLIILLDGFYIIRSAIVSAK